MQHYLNLGGDSGVAAYEIGDTSIEVMFKDGMIYRYTVQSAGAASIETMKQLAVAGKGLNSFISRYVRKGYDSKRR